MDYARRNFLFGRGDRTPPLRPPWVAEAALLAGCTRCGACGTACHSEVIAIGSGGYPELRPHKGECTFCGLCAEACSAPVFDLRRKAFTHVVAIGETCLSTRGTECRACQDVCPEGAIRFRLRVGRAAAPELDADACTGCGACVSHCPADAIKVTAITEEPLDA